MRASLWLSATQKETPHDAEIISHQLMLRAGMIRKLGQGLYTWLPLGLKVLRKVERIVREEMNNIGGMEVLMPAVQPAELWQETGRWETFGGLLLTMQDSNKREYCFGPTHEEVITDLARNVLHSYKQLPATFYQIQTKFRDEIRPRFGVMRAREFLMKDAYSFHLNQESLQSTYDDFYSAYSKIFDRLGLQYRAVEADTGAIGGSSSHEFQVLADSGEDLIFYSDTSPYAANIEQANSLAPSPATTYPKETLQSIDTPGKKTISDLVNFLNIPAHQIIKTLIVEGTEHPMIALVLKGDDELNEIKASKHPLVKSPLNFIKEEQIFKTLHVPVGSLGPVNLPIPILVDNHARALSEFVCGANSPDKHYLHAAWGRDAQYREICDLRNVKEGDISPDGQGVLKSCRGIEVGHIFQLGDKYTKAMQVKVLDAQSQAQTLIMGTYGIGVSRIVAAAIEQHHDAKGIVWPEALAPFQLVIIPINQSIEAVKHQAESLYKNFVEQGFEVLLDDREERPGVLFADNDLMGIPHRLVISARNLEQGVIEYKARKEESATLIPLNDVPAYMNKILKRIT